MIQLTNQTGWRLDDNGVSIVDEDGKQIADLRNEFKVIGLKKSEGNLTLKLKKVEDFTNNSYIRLEQEATLQIHGVVDADLPNFDFPCEFEGIYDFKNNLLSLCVGSEACYPVKGKDLSISCIF